MHEQRHTKMLIKATYITDKQTYKKCCTLEKNF